MLYEESYLAKRQLSKAAKLWLFLHFTVRTAQRADIFTRSAALSYTVVFSLVPLIATLLAFLTAFSGLKEQRETLMKILSSYLLPGAVEGLEEKFAQFSERAAAAGSLSSLFFFVSVLMLYQALEVAMDSIWDPERGRTWPERLRALAFFLTLGALATGAFVAIREQASQMAIWWGAADGLASTRFERSILGGSLNVLVACALFVLSVRFLPSVKMRWASAVLGGVAGGVVWHFLKSGFTWYVENMASYNNIYGALGAIPIFFLWVYLSFLLLLFSACLAYAFQNLESSIMKEQAKGRGYPRGFFAVLVAGDVHRAFREGEPPPSNSEIAGRLGLPAFVVSDLLSWLQEANLVRSIEDKGDHFYLPARPGFRTTYLDLVDAASGDSLLVSDQTAPGPSKAMHEKVKHAFQDARQALEESLRSHSLDEVWEARPSSAQKSPVKPARRNLAAGE